MMQDVDAVVRNELDARAGTICSLRESDFISFTGPLLYGVEDLIRKSIESIRVDSDRTRLTVFLTTHGGYIEPVQRVVETFRHHYDTVEFLVPDCAYSAGTVLVMSGDAIWMNYFSRLGPIDPQVASANGTMVPALGYLERWNDFLKKASQGKLSLAEIQVMIYSFDQAELYRYAQEKELTIALLKEWLVKYKFKDWKETQTRRLPVTDLMKRRRAADIAKQLNDTGRWHSHGQGIPMKTVREGLRLLIDDFDDAERFPGLGDAVKRYSDLLSDYMVKQGQTGVIHVSGSYLPFQWRHDDA